ncbi:MAG: GNAT family N-acetyltransferase [Bacteroidales bacterium]|jgi:hypothetical protein|nr:GNAT family N-acetyltransferase [Bacteroidales bacterium]MCI2145953.1 GNAT family N-acetyltransferase [Bacteroidales bacterium]
MDKPEMQPIIDRVDRELIIKELTNDKFVRTTRRGGNEIYEVTSENSPNTMREIGRTREISFRTAGGGTGLPSDIDAFDIDKEHPYKQLIVWDPEEKEIIGGYRYILCKGIHPENMATRELFNFSDKFVNEIMPVTIELGRSFVQPMYQRLNLRRKGIYAVDNLWDGLGALMVKYPEYKYFFGKVTMYKDYDVIARNFLLNFMKIYFPDPDKLVTCIEPLDIDEANPIYSEPYAGLPVDEAFHKMQHEVRAHGEQVPPLINSYISLSDTMRTFGTCNNYGFGGVEETGILIYIPDIKTEKAERHVQPMKDLADKLLSDWFKRREKIQRAAEERSQNWKRAVNRARKFARQNSGKESDRDGMKKKRERKSWRFRIRRKGDN